MSSAGPRRPRRAGRPLALAGALAAVVAGCGWHTGLTAPGGAESVGIQVFGTRADLLERNLEPILADALSKAVLQFVQTPLAAPGEADVVVRGEIVEYRRRSGTRNRENELVETGVRIDVRAELLDARSGRVIVPALQRHVWSGYALAGEGERNEDAARERALRYVAETLVLDLFRARAAAPGAAEGDASPAQETPPPVDPDAAGAS